MIKRLAIIILALAAVFGGAYWYRHKADQAMELAMASYAPPPATVTASKAVSQDWTDHVRAVGTVTSLNSVALSPETSGTVVAVHYRSGQKVKRGAPLVDISHKVESAALAALNANLIKTRHDFERFEDLYKRNVVSAETLSKYRDAFHDAKSALDAHLARLARKTVRAPFSGTVGISNVEVGQYVDAGHPLVRLTQLTPIYVDAYIRQQDFPKISQNLEVDAHIDSWPGATFKGRISSIDPFLDPDTRQIKIRASFDNKDGKLLPGMFGTLDIVLASRHDFVTVPRTAVSYRMDGDTVYVLAPAKGEADKKKVYTAMQVPVKVARTGHGKAAVAEGLKAGDLVATSGQIKLYDGARVVVDNKVDPARAAEKK